MPAKKRYIILDALRGFALLGICLANYPEFSLWTFADSAGYSHTDKIVQTLLTFFVDGKFYTLFSILFGMGFAIQLENASGTIATFYRRMTILFLIGLLHLCFLWSGDILMLYAAMGMLLPLFRKLRTKSILMCAGGFLLLPILCDALLGTRLSDPIEATQWAICGRYGISETNFATWLRDAQSYREVLQFLHQGAIERMWEFVCSHRYFKVLGLFLIGYAAGREKIYADLDRYTPLLKRVLTTCLCIGIPLGIAYTFSAMQSKPFGQVAHSMLYVLGVYPMGIAYAALFCLLYSAHPKRSIWRSFSFPGRMACTNYLFQSIFGIAIFYGIGLGVGAGVSLAKTELIALIVYTTQLIISSLWLRYFRYGPIEWIWRMLTYGKTLPLKNGNK